MKYLLIRHAKTDANRSSRALYGKAGAPINKEGEAQADELHEELRKLGIDFQQPVAVSEFLRVQQTANLAGFDKLVENSLLNEIKLNDINLAESLFAKQQIPPEVEAAAKKLIANPPKQKIWFTHGLVIAAVLVVLNKVNPDKFFPDMCEITEIDI